LWSLYAGAVAEQKEFGRTTALNTPIRGADNKLTYVDITKTMSQVARDAARPIIERDYALAIKGDMTRVIQDARMEAGEDQERFKELSTTKLKGLMDAVPDDFKVISKSVLEESGSQTQAEHYYDMSIKAAAKQKRIALENLQFNTRNNIDEIIPLITAGDIASAQEMYQNIRDQINGSKTPDGEVVHEGFIAEGFTDQNVRALNMELDKAYFGTLLSKDHTTLMENGEYPLAESLMRSLLTGKIDMSGNGVNAAKLAEMGITQDSIDDFSDPDVREAISANMRLTASSFADRIRANADAVASASVQKFVFFNPLLLTIPAIIIAVDVAVSVIFCRLDSLALIACFGFLLVAFDFNPSLTNHFLMAVTISDDFLPLLPAGALNA